MNETPLASLSPFVYGRGEYSDREVDVIWWGFAGGEKRGGVEVEWNGVEGIGM